MCRHNAKTRHDYHIADSARRVAENTRQGWRIPLGGGMRLTLSYTHVRRHLTRAKQAHRRVRKTAWVHAPHLPSAGTPSAGTPRRSPGHPDPTPRAPRLLSWVPMYHGCPSETIAETRYKTGFNPAGRCAAGTAQAPRRGLRFFARRGGVERA